MSKSLMDNDCNKYYSNLFLTYGGRVLQNSYSFSYLSILVVRSRHKSRRSYYGGECKGYRTVGRQVVDPAVTYSGWQNTQRRTDEV